MRVSRAVCQKYCCDGCTGEAVRSQHNTARQKESVVVAAGIGLVFRDCPTLDIRVVELLLQADTIIDTASSRFTPLNFGYGIESFRLE